MLLIASSPYAKRGELYNAFRRHYGKDDARVLVWKASTEAMNPSLDRAIIEEAYESDPEAARAEYGAEFRDDLADYITREAIDAVMQRARRPVPPPGQLARDSLAVIEGRLVWTKGTAGNPRRGKEAGTDRPDGRRVVSIRRGSRRSSQLWTIDSTRVAFFLAFEHWPRGVVDFRDGDSRNLRGENLFERERRARSTGRKGGLEAERARDRATLARPAEGVATVEAIAQATGVGRSNVSRRLSRLAATGLVERMCAPNRAHWLLTTAGTVETMLADEVDLLKRVDLNGYRAPWVAPLSATKLSRETYCGYGRAEPVRVEGDAEHKEERPESVRRAERACAQGPHRIRKMDVRVKSPDLAQGRSRRTRIGRPLSEGHGERQHAGRDGGTTHRHLDSRSTPA